MLDLRPIPIVIVILILAFVVAFSAQANFSTQDKAVKQVRKALILFDRYYHPDFTNSSDWQHLAQLVDSVHRISAETGGLWNVPLPLITTLAQELDEAWATIQTSQKTL